MKRPLQGRCAIFLTLFAFAFSGFAADNIGPQLRAEIERAKPKLGVLRAWQEEAFLSEVLASSGRFVRDYQTKGGTVTRAVVDTDGIKKYLSFHASQILKPENLNVLLAVRANDKCTACVGAVPTVRNDLKARLERRGMQVLILNAQESRRDLMEALTAKGAVGWVMADIKSVDDLEHPGDVKYELGLEFRFPGTVASRIQKQMEIQPSESIEIAMSRLSIDGISELGAKVQLARVSAMEQQGSDGIEIALSGVTEFTQLIQLKNALQDKLSTQGRVVERRFAHGQSVLAVFTSLSATELAAQLGQPDLGKFRVRVGAVSNEQIQAAFIPLAAGRP